MQFITVNDEYDAAAKVMVEELRGDLVRAELNSAQDSMGKKIRNAIKAKIPHVVVIGEKEVANQEVTVRRYGSEEQTTMPFAEFKADMLRRIRERELDAARMHW